MSADNTLRGAYFVKFTENGNYTDVTTLVDGVRVLKVEGINERGKPVNIYTAQWVNSQTEDFEITTLDANQNPVVIRENVDIEITFLVHQRYATNTIDVLTQHDLFVDYLTNQDIWVKTTYADKEVHCVCLEAYEPTTVKLKRNSDSNYMLGTIRLHTLETPKRVQ